MKTCNISGRSEPVGGIKSGQLRRNNPLDAGQDIFSAEDVIILAGQSALVSTDLRIQVPPGYVGLVWPRSGLSVKYQIEVGAGCIDAGYQGEVKVHLYNHSNNSYHVKVGDRIAQLLTLPVNLHDYEPIEEFADSERGEAGFGASGRS